MPEQPSQERGGKCLTGSCTETRPRETWIFSYWSCYEGFESSDDKGVKVVSGHTYTPRKHLLLNYPILSWQATDTGLHYLLDGSLGAPPVRILALPDQFQVLQQELLHVMHHPHTHTPAGGEARVVSTMKWILF